MFYHAIDPVLFSLGPFEIRYYGVIYALGFIITYFMLRSFIRQKKLRMREEHLESLIIYLVVGVVLGARLFEILFYNFPYYLQNPLQVFAIWKGGLSFHGGLVGGLLAVMLFGKKYKYSVLHLGDYIVIPASLALALGRIGNFLNGELWGRVTSLPWSVQFPNVEGFRHPSQLYEALKNIIIFLILRWQANLFFLVKWQAKKERKDGYLLGLFLILYGVLRFLVEFVREPEIYVGPLTMGQLLTIPLVIIGIFLVNRSK